MKKLILFEFRKIFAKRLTLLALAVVVLLSILLSASTYQNKHAFDGVSREGSGRAAVEIDKSIAAKYAGILTDEKVQQMLSNLVPKRGQDGINVRYIYQNTMQSAVAARFSDMDGNWNGLSVKDVFGDEKIKIGYVDGWLGASQNLVKIFLVLAFVIIIMIAPVFSGEYSGIDNIILTSRHGKTKCATAKVIASILASVLVTAVTIVIHILTALVMYGTEGLDCSILFAQMDFVEGYIPFNITCGTLLIYQIVLAVASAVSVSGITLILSAACKNQTVALVVSAAVYICPFLLPVNETTPLFRIVGLLPMYYSQFVSLMSVEQMGNGMLYAVWAVPVAGIIAMAGIVISPKVFAGHQVMS